MTPVTGELIVAVSSGFPARLQGTRWDLYPVVPGNHGKARFTPGIVMTVKDFGTTGRKGESYGKGYFKACFH